MTQMTKDYAAGSDKAALRRLGQQVCERLEANPSVYKVPTDKAQIYAFGNFISPDECRRMIAMIDQCATPSKVFDLDYSSGYRTSYSGDVDPHHPLVRKLNRRIDDLMGIDPECGETIQGQRYMPGQEFKPHHDWFHPNTSYWDFEMARGGQRSFTAMAFLNKPEGGGTTDFTELRMSIEPQPGALLIWNNADINGVPNPLTMHAGRPVTEGVKYIFTKWYRTRKWN